MADIFSMLSGGVLDILNTLFNPLLALDPNPQNPALTVLVIAFIVSLITTVANKYLVDQDKVNENQKKSRELSSRMREAQKKGDGKELAKLQAEQTEMLKNQNAVMMESFKPMLVTFVPIILIFFWMRTSIISNLVLILPAPAYWLTLFHWSIFIWRKSYYSIWYWLVIMVYDLYFWYESNFKKILRIQTRVLI